MRRISLLAKNVSFMVLILHVHPFRNVKRPRTHVLKHSLVCADVIEISEHGFSLIGSALLIYASRLLLATWALKHQHYSHSLPPFAACPHPPSPIVQLYSFFRLLRCRTFQRLTFVFHFLLNLQAIASYLL